MQRYSFFSEEKNFPAGNFIAPIEKSSLSLPFYDFLHKRDYLRIGLPVKRAYLATSIIIISLIYDI